jgi:hypothetical protein
MGPRKISRSNLWGATHQSSRGRPMGPRKKKPVAPYGEVGIISRMPAMGPRKISRFTLYGATHHVADARDGDRANSAVAPYGGLRIKYQSSRGRPMGPREISISTLWGEGQ